MMTTESHPALACGAWTGHSTAVLLSRDVFVWYFPNYLAVIPKLDFRVCKLVGCHPSPLEVVRVTL